MGTEHTAEEAKQIYISQMGEPLGKLYSALWQELAWLYSKWDEYVTLFGTKPSRIDLMNKAAPKFFRVVQDSLWEDTILHIARLTDKPKTSGKSNLSIRHISTLIDDNKTKNNVDKLINEAIKKSEFCRDWRNRHIAHRDLERAIDDEADPLLPASRKKVKDALKAISDVLNAVTMSFSDSETGFDMGSESYHGALSLLHIINDGLEAAKEKDERIQRGEYKEEDFKPSEI